MKILVTGGCGFIGSHVAERFVKEGHCVCIIDNLSAGVRDNVRCEHQFYQLDVVDRACEEIFRIHNFDLVVHLVEELQNELHFEMQQDRCVAGLSNIINLARMYQVKKVIYLSKTSVAAEVEPLAVAEAAAARQPEYGQASRSAAAVGTAVTAIALATVYGPRQHIGQGVARLINHVVRQDELIIYGNASDLSEYLYVEDVAYGIYQAAIQATTERFIYLSANVKHSLSSFLKMLSSFASLPPIRYEQTEQADSSCDNADFTRLIGWYPKYNLEQGLLKTYEWYKNNEVQLQAPEAPGRIKRFFAPFFPYVENIALFGLLSLLTLSDHLSLIDLRLGIDYGYIYIALMGFLYGKHQSILATFLAGVLFTVNFLTRGADWVALLYQSQYLLHLASYLCIGIVTGNVIDSKNRDIQDLTVELDRLKDRYRFLEKIHLEVNAIKDNLYTQIVNSEDSIGRIYSIVSKLDSLEIERIYTVATGIVKNITKAETAVLYTVTKDGLYLRLRTKAGSSYTCVNSLQIADHAYLQQIMQQQTIFINSDLVAGLPAMAAPILYEGKVIAILETHNVVFENFTLFYKNLFKTTVLFITDALIKAYLYDETLVDRKYLKDTAILLPEAFEKVLVEMENRRDLSGQSLALLKVTSHSNNEKTLYEKMQALLRTEDYMGLRNDGCVYLLLTNIHQQTVACVQERLQKNGVIATQI